MEGGYRIYRRVGSRREPPKTHLELTRSGAKTATAAAEKTRRKTLEKNAGRERKRKKKERKKRKISEEIK